MVKIPEARLIPILAVMMVAMAVTAQPTGVHGAWMNGEALFKECTASPKRHRSKRSFCYAYIAGSIDGGDDVATIFQFLSRNQNTVQKLQTLHLLQNAVVCLPDKITLEKLRVLVVRHLRDNPKLQSNTAASSVRDAIRKAYPCGE